MKANPGSAFIFYSGPEVIRNPDVHFPFRQESNFYYLTGFEEPDSYLLLLPPEGESSAQGKYRTVLFVRKRDREKEMWEGERYGTDGATAIFGADEAYPVDEIGQRLAKLLKGSEKVFYRIGVHENTDRLILASLEEFRKSMGRTGKSLSPIHDPNEVLGEMRLFKSSEEIEILRKACRITALAHKTLMEEVKPGMNEFEVEALIDFTFRRNGCQRVGYGSIVAGGKNATCLHYRSNNEALREGNLLLVDAGGELNYYTSDITRVFPIGRSFTPAQGKLYDLVLKAQLEAISLAKPGASLPAIHQRVNEVLVDGLLSLGLLKGKAEEIIKNGGHKRFYPHNTSHWLGMDVHDVGLYFRNGQPRLLEPGMVFTIEPGLYTQPTDKEVPREFAEIGIRIEDNVLITQQGCENLTVGAPKDRAEIEKIRGSLR